MNVTGHLARFFAETSYGALPPEVIHEAKRCIADGIGVALGGADHPSAEILLKYCRTLDGTPEAQIWGHPDRLPVEPAALVNGHQGHVLDFDDTFLPPETALHGTVPLLSPLLAVPNSIIPPAKRSCGPLPWASKPRPASPWPSAAATCSAAGM